MNRSAQKRLAEIANEPFEHLDGIDLTWYAIGRIDAMQNHINKLQSELAELRKDRERMKRENGALRSAFHVNMLKAYPQKSHQEISDEIDNAMKEVK